MTEAAVEEPETGAAGQLVAWMRAAGEPTRMRLIVLLEKSDLTVSDLMEILGQSQPRLSRHLKLLVDAGLANRFQEGAWAYFRTVETGAARHFLDSMTKPLEYATDPVLQADRQKLEAILNRRDQRAADYFAKNAQQWTRIRSLHVEEDAVEEAMLEMGLAHNPASILDLGTGTGRILQLFAPHVDRGLGIDLSHDMLAVARSALAPTEFDHIKIRHSSVYELADNDTFDLITMHQVVHFLEDPVLAFQAASGRLTGKGVMLIADFMPHSIEELRDKHAHRRLGIDRDQLERWLESANLRLTGERLLAPPEDDDMSLTVALWTAAAA